MADEAAALVVRLEATQARFQRDMRRAESVFDRSAGGIERRANGLDSRLARVGTPLVQGFNRAAKSAEASASVFEAALQGAARDFRRLEGSMDPAIRALHEYERAQEIVAQAVRQGAVTQAQANAVLARAHMTYLGAGRQVLGAGAQYRQFGNVVQQAGFQVGDFAVQVASGQGVLRPFIQQGTQLVSMFGPWGAVIGAAGAIVGALATSLISAGDASEEADGSLDDLADTADSLEGAVSDLTSIVEAYADAIRDTAVASDYASARIIANSKAEFDARQQLLRLDTFDTRQQQFQRKDEIKRLRQEEADTRRGGDFGTLFDEERLRRRIPQEFTAETPALTEARRAAIDRAKEAAKQAQDISRQASRLEATSTLVQQQIDEADRLLGMSFDEVLTQVGETRAAGEARSSAGKSGGGGASSDKNVDAIRREIQAILDRRNALEREQSLIGLSERGQVKLTAAYEKQRIVEELLNKAREDGITLTPAQIEQAHALAGEIESLAVANYDMKEALESHAEAAKEAQKRQEDLAKSVTDVADRMLSAIQQADSFADALVNIGLEIAKLSIAGLGGQGPLGGLLGGVLSGIIGGGAGFSVGGGAGSSAFFSGGIGGGSLSFSAKGNAFKAGNIIPFARGGVVGGPTLFPMSNGTGLMGEAGPEAVMPLKRGASGRLGVEGGSARVVIELSPGLEGRLLGQAHQNAVIEIRQSEARTLQKVPTTAAAGFGQRPSLRR